MSTCPTCNGSGVAEVGLVGFDLGWRITCPDCDGEKTVSYPKVRGIKDEIVRRMEKGLPRRPPSGLYY